MAQKGMGLSQGYITVR